MGGTSLCCAEEEREAQRVSDWPRVTQPAGDNLNVELQGRGSAGSQGWASCSQGPESHPKQALLLGLQRQEGK